MFVSLGYYGPDNTIKIISSRSMSLLALFLDRRRPPKTKSTYLPVPFFSGREIILMISLYVSYVAGRRLELVTPVSAVRRAGDCVITSCLCNDNE